MAINVFGWVVTHPIKAALLGLVLTLVIGTANALQMTPRNDRNWKEYPAHIPHVVQSSDSFSVTPVNNWSYAAAGPTDKSESSFEARIAENVWFVLEPSPASNWIGHTFLLLEFSGDNEIEAATATLKTKGIKFTDEPRNIARGHEGLRCAARLPG